MCFLLSLSFLVQMASAAYLGGGEGAGTASKKPSPGRRGGRGCLSGAEEDKSGVQVRLTSHHSVLGGLGCLGYRVAFPCLGLGKPVTQVIGSLLLSESYRCSESTVKQDYLSF